MKTVLLVNDYTYEYGGAENVVFALKALLEEKGHRVYVLGGRGETLFSFFGRFFNGWYFLKALVWIVRYKIDIVHMHNCSRVVSPSPAVAAKMLGKRVVMTVHDFHLYCPKTWGIFQDDTICTLGYNKKCWKYDCYHPKKNKLFQFFKRLKVGIHRYLFARYIDVFLCPSRALQSYIQGTMPVDPAAVLHTPYYVNTIVVEKSKEYTKGEYFLYVGRISPQKGIDYLLKATKYVKEKGRDDIRVKIIGNGKDMERLQTMHKKLDLGELVEFVGRVEHNLLGKRYQDANAVIIPSVRLENNPLVALEAMQQSKPLVATRIGGLPDMVEDGKNGFLFGFKNYEKLGDILITMMDIDQESYDGLCNHSHHLITTKFSGSDVYERLMEVYER